MHDEVVITGLGPVTSIGVGGTAVWESLKARRNAVGVRTLPVDVGSVLELPLAAMPDAAAIDGLDLHEAFLRTQECDQARDLGYAMLATELALTDAEMEYDRASNTMGMVQVFEAPGVERTVQQMFAMLNGPPPEPGPPRVYEALAPAFYNMQSFVYVHLLSKAFGFHGLCTSVHNACSSGAVAIQTAAATIAAGKADVMVVVGGEAFDTAVRLQWFKTLDLYAQTVEMRPFDAVSSGFFVGEGAGAIVLESRRHAERRGATPYAVCLGGRTAHQSWKQTVPDIRAARLTSVIQETMTAAGISPPELDLIVAHGSATSLSDRYEAKCLADALGGGLDGAAGMGFKPYVGHLLAASGIMDAICGLLCMRFQAVPGMPHQPIEPIPVPMALPRELQPHAIETLMLLSTGITGHDTATLYRKY